MDLKEYDNFVGGHLDAIEYYSAMCAYHTRCLRAVPDYETKALDRLKNLDVALRTALEIVEKAIRVYGEKPHA